MRLSPIFVAVVLIEGGLSNANPQGSPQESTDDDKDNMLMEDSLACCVPGTADTGRDATSFIPCADCCKFSTEEEEEAMSPIEADVEFPDTNAVDGTPSLVEGDDPNDTGPVGTFLPDGKAEKDTEETLTDAPFVDGASSATTDSGSELDVTSDVTCHLRHHRRSVQHRAAWGRLRPQGSKGKVF